MKNSAIAALLFFLLIIASSWLSIQLLAPPRVQPISANEQSFSAERARRHLELIAKAPHSVGTVEHSRVLQYIDSTCRHYQLKVQLQRGIGLRSYPGFLNSGMAHNLIATLPGSASSKAILIVAHYDSQPHTPGAADDGASVVAMLETIRALKTSSPLKNDIIFLFTDLEEVGLLGAEAFVNEFADLNKIGVVLNYEARGNSGISFTFEVSNENGWIVRQFMRNAPYPFINSVAYEIYKLMPNSSDFTVFRKQELTGLNSAFINGFVNYHSMTDTPENLDLRSLQHQGSNMLAMAKHLGNSKLENTKAPDSIFFNPIGHLSINYPAWLDIPFLLLTMALFSYLLILSFGRKQMTISSILMGILLFLLDLGLSLGTVWLLNKAVLSAYPQYHNFYNANFYNVYSYLVAFLGLSLLIFGLLSHWFLKKFSWQGLLAGGIFIILILMILLKIYLQTAAYVLYYPIAFLLVSQIVLLFKNWKIEERPIRSLLVYLIGILPALGLWVPFIYILFTIFSLKMPLASIVLMVFVLTLCLPGLSLLPHKKRLLLPLTGLLILSGGLLHAHLNSTPSANKPLQSNIFYALDKDSGKAFWISPQKELDSWNRKFIQKREKEPFDEYYPEWKWMVWKNQAPSLTFPNVELKLIKDSLINDSLHFCSVHIQPQQNVNLLELWLPENTDVTALAGKIDTLNNARKKHHTRIFQYVVPEGGIQIDFQTSNRDTLNIRIVERILGLPKELYPSPRPAHIIPAPGSRSHFTHVKQSFQIINGRLKGAN